MNRTKQITIAAVLLFVVSLLNALSEIPNLSRGTAAGPDEAPFALAMLSFTLNVVGIFAAYGLWQNMRWGKILTVVVMALNILYTLLPVIFAPIHNKIIGIVVIALYTLVITLVLRSTPKLAGAKI